ncbi:MAG: CoA pyrophosphatase [Armatimonadota bacterium]|nr:CoA pyrophosphatase [Armatimonadota bacterium]MDR7451854.1 CoA pyrophosphatase [Armatimonadota bacterium]MDR7467579.1 CoA pyrophosphatase [Armatimonadota bacterium]MDR7494460.1 CoA pyrophosphatase [Armatimonadota bacterium]MDR7499721.1 CoA pyrophosphatase [Armatimonadota bacterium]
MTEDFFAVVERRLAGIRRRIIADAALRRAAVLLPLFRDGGEICVLFTRRTETVEHHKGQISLPGGEADAADQDPVETALREMEEELGIPRREVRVLGLLDDVHTLVSGFVITPVVGVVPPPTALRVSVEEIAEVLSVPLSVFRDPARRRVEVRMGPAGEQVEVSFFEYGPYVIWGATARIMRTFVAAAFGE